MSQGEHDVRPFYACEGCSLVYARYRPPAACGVCGAENFVDVMPKDQRF